MSTAQYNKYKADLTKNSERHKELASTIYENETHSAIAEFVMGTNTSGQTESDRPLSKNQMKELFTAYKELHGV